MKILFFGTYDPNYSRNSILIRGLKKNDVEILQCNVYDDYFFIPTINNSIKFFKLNYELLKKYISLSDYDLIFNAYNGHKSYLLAKLISKINRKPLVFDPFECLYNTWAIDFAKISPNGTTSKIVRILENYMFNNCDLLLSDTNAHGWYFSKEYSINRQKIYRVLVGADDRIYYPIAKAKNKKFKIFFFGSYVPLQGYKYVFEAAKKLKNNSNIEITLLGADKTNKDFLYFNREKRNLNMDNFILHPKVKEIELIRFISETDVCLGIFGETIKAKLVIPNKAYASIAMKKPLITANTPAIKELFTDKKNCLLCNIADSDSLVDSILRLYSDPDFSEKISLNGYDLYQKNCRPEIIGKDLKLKLEKLINH